MTFRQAGRVQPRRPRPPRLYGRAMVPTAQQQQAMHLARLAAAQQPGLGVPRGLYGGAYPMGVRPRRPLLSFLWRHRRHWPPFVWGFAGAVAPVAVHAHHMPVIACLGAGFVPGMLIILATRHLKSEFLQHWWLATGAATAVLVPLVAIAGPKPWLIPFAVCWLGLTGAHARYYRIRPQEEPEPVPDSERETWAKLADHRGWHAKLGTPESIPNGKRYPLRFDGIKTHVGDVLPHPLAVAAAYRRPVTEAYVEPSSDGDPSQGHLVLLRNGTLQDIRHWDGHPATSDGFATIGRYADTTPARIRLFVPRDGARHSIIAGAMGSGKSALLDLLIRIYLASGIYPVILDPQNGQSLPQWRGRVPYAAGAEECMELLTLFHQGMMDRSRRLSQMEWQQHGRTVQGMGFFDSTLTGMPLVRAVMDEHPVLLKDRQFGADATFITGEIGKLGRKAGAAEDVVCQVPSLSELQDQVVRSMLTACNVIGLRTGDKVSGGMLNLPADPCDLPQYFRNGEPTYGLGYIVGPDNRQVIGRTDVPTPEQMAADYPMPVLEPEFAAILARFGQRIAEPAPAAGLVAVDDTPAPGGKTAADAVLAVLTRPMERGEIIRAAQDKSVQWGRANAFSMDAIKQALRKLRDDGRITQAGERSPYAPVRASLNLVDTTREGESA